MARNFLPADGRVRLATVQMSGGSPNCMSPWNALGELGHRATDASDRIEAMLSCRTCKRKPAALDQSPRRSVREQGPNVFIDDDDPAAQPVERASDQTADFEARGREGGSDGLAEKENR